ncbi:Qa-SNARE protein, Tlg2/syntaxin16-family [Haematococcus lacustris]|uniref:Qa-SNARE protein, Tlg2/syntaxin16-family n=1 Tax=Haematococcus lacustris TaxID=44745 RepID=A0A699YZF9_HAELA|nr:Qa-SNARE protein, Tlg2/syntaxin16-family [Haematococcus lacustris]
MAIGSAQLGTTRSLTSQFFKLRNDARRAMGISGVSDKATLKLVGAALQGSSTSEDMDATATTSATAPVWLQTSEKVRSEMGILKDRLAKLREAHGRALLVTFDNENTGHAHADALTRDIQATFRRLDAEIRGMDKGAASSEDAAVRLQIQRQLAQALFKLSVEFRKEETRFLNKVEAQKGIKMNLNEADPGFTQAQLAVVDISNALAQERDAEIRRIVETITELAQIMRDLSEMVVEQGHILDRIDRNIEKVAESVGDGVGQLKAAVETQKRSRMFLCIIGLIVTIVLLVIIVMIRHI